MSSHRERVSAYKLRPGDRIYWLSRYGNERGRAVSAVWDSEDTPGAVCVLFDQLMLGDTFWPGESFVRKMSTAVMAQPAAPDDQPVTGSRTTAGA
jgi:hypothetical protein